MRAFFVALAQIMKGIFGILWAPFQFVGNLFSSPPEPQEQADAVVRRAMSETHAEELASGAEEKITLDEAHTLKRVAGRLLLGKPIAPGTRVSPGMLEALNGFPRPLLKRIADGHPDMVAGIVDGYRGGFITETARAKEIPQSEIEAAFPKLSARIAAHMGGAANDEAVATRRLDRRVA